MAEEAESHPDGGVRPPAGPNRLIGRARELAALLPLLMAADGRLVTLTGPGGVGKTRLAAEAARQAAADFRDGVRIVELAAVQDPAFVPRAIAEAIALPVAADRPLLDQLVTALSTRQLLLVLDNVEHLLAASPALDALIAGCPALTVLTTSRAPLQLRREREFPVEPLSLPGPDEVVTLATLDRYAALTLFVERATAIHPDFTLSPPRVAALVRVCARLDGLPLAIELAAARTRVLSPEAMLPRLVRSLDLLQGRRRDVPPRQQTLRNTIAWSHDLLRPHEQALFRRLAVFVGGFTLDAAMYVAGDAPPVRAADSVAPPAAADVPDPPLDGIEALVENSLLRTDPAAGSGPRYAMLETIREFGLERLVATGDEAAVRERHLACCLRLAEQGDLRENSPRIGAWLDRFEADHDNMRAALAWAVADDRDLESGLRLACALSNFWAMRGYHAEGREWLRRLLDRSPAPSPSRGHALHRAGYLALRQNDYAVARAQAGAALAIFREHGLRRGVAAALTTLGTVAQHERDFERADAMLRESVAIFRELDDAAGLHVALRDLADLARSRGCYPEAVAHYSETLAISRARGDDHGIAYALRGLGHVARAEGDHPRARALLRESLSLLAGLRDRRCIPLCLESLACMEVGSHWAARAATLLGAARAIQEKTGAPAPPDELADALRTEADARAALGVARFDEHRAAGARLALSLDDTVAYALAGGETPTPAGGRHAVRPAGRRRQRSTLSDREADVVALVVEGLGNPEIAERLTLSVRTVERHLENIYNRLGFSGRAARAMLVASALRHGLLDDR